MKRADDWRVASVPAAYGDVDDSATCRHVRVSRSGLTLDGLKRSILAAYENQYEPHEIKLFTRVYDDVPKQVRERGVLKAISYDPDWEDLDLGNTGDMGTVLLIISPLDEAEAELLVLPAAHSPPTQVVKNHAAPPAGTCAVAASSLTIVDTLANSDTALFDPLPLPAHVDDWLAQYREAPQSVTDFIGLADRVLPSAAQHSIYLQPLVLPGRSPRVEAAETRLFEGLHAFLSAFYTGVAAVRLADAVPLSIDKQRRRAHTLNSKSILWRDTVPSTSQSMPHGQLSAPHLLEALKPRPSRSGGTKGQQGGTKGKSTRPAGRVGCGLNGCGHLKEDFASPPYLCPVDLGKIAVAAGGRCDLVARYSALLAFCEMQPIGFDEFAAWLRRALAVTRATSTAAVPAATMSNLDALPKAPKRQRT
uniref:Uncharacterized protein n=1 Tax=Haptolina brevifila TaxID=156173 RepID=A0A7S2MDF5_9EUKA